MAIELSRLLLVCAAAAMLIAPALGCDLRGRGVAARLCSETKIGSARQQIDSRADELGLTHSIGDGRILDGGVDTVKEYLQPYTKLSFGLKGCWVRFRNSVVVEKEFFDD